IVQPGVERFETQEFECFSSWADDLWNESKSQYALAAVRDSRTLNLLYPSDDKHFIKLRVTRDGKTVGWAVAGERRKDPKYGEMRIGSIIDCCAVPGSAVPVIRSAAHALIGAGVDLIVSNQAHRMWQEALKACAFLEAESNFI